MGKYGRQKEELDVFVQQQNMKRVQYRLESPYSQQNQPYSHHSPPYPQHNQGFYGNQYVSSTQ